MTISTGFNEIIENDEEKFAVRTRNVCFSVRKGSKEIPILNCVDMDIPKGAIYGLLGPSGCGKTSILKVIVGLMKPNAGFISVFGYPPRTPESGVPGQGVGYMPQDVGLQDNLTIEELFYYFGKLYFIDDETIKKQMKSLLSLLQLPPKNRFIETLSGGQQRRLSLAVTILNRPRLVILDEPTVGVDPILRSEIWKFVTDMTEKEQITLIVTTHYIEEMKFAKKVAFMRKGEILGEGSPNELLEAHKKQTLEEVFYTICVQQKHVNANLRTKKEIKRASIASAAKEMQGCIEEPFHCSKKLNPFIKQFILLKVLVWKYSIQLFRAGGAQFCYLFPALMLFFCSLSLGPVPKDVQLGWIVNDIKPNSSAFFLNNTIEELMPFAYDTESPFEENSDDYYERTKYDNYQTPYLPDLFKSCINNRVIKLIPYADVKKAREDAKNSKLFGYIHLRANFSSAFIDSDIFFSENDELVDNKAIENGNIFLSIDKTQIFLADIITRELDNAVSKFREATGLAMGFKQIEVEYPISIKEVIYGKEVTENFTGFQNFFAISILQSVMLGLSIMSASIAFFFESNADIFLRIFSTGVKPVHLILYQALSRFLFMSLSSILQVFFVIYVLGYECKGPLIYAQINIVLMSLCGVGIGILIAVVINSIFMCQIMVTFVFCALLMTTGVLWPFESVPYFVQWCFDFLPLRYPTYTMRNIFNYSNAPFTTHILPGFLTSIWWSLVSTFLSWYFMRNRY